MLLSLTKIWKTKSAILIFYIIFIQKDLIVEVFLCFFVVVMQTLCTDHFREGEIAALFNAETAEGRICDACHRRKQHGYAAACIAAKYF